MTTGSGIYGVPPFGMNSASTIWVPSFGLVRGERVGSWLMAMQNPE